MKQFFILASIAFLCATKLFAQSPAKEDEIQIKEVITKAYLIGIHNQGDLEEVKKGFHPGFEMLMVRNGSFSKMPFYTWLEILEARRKDPLYKPIPIEWKFLSVDVCETTAVVKLELYRENKLIFTDFLSLYKFEEGWKIVSKTYHTHN